MNRWTYRYNRNWFKCHTFQVGFKFSYCIVATEKHPGAQWIYQKWCYLTGRSPKSCWQHHVSNPIYSYKVFFVQEMAFLRNVINLFQVFGLYQPLPEIPSLRSHPSKPRNWTKGKVAVMLEVQLFQLNIATSTRNFCQTQNWSTEILYEKNSSDWICWIEGKIWIWPMDILSNDAPIHLSLS